MIKPDNKHFLLQNLITEELITKQAQHNIMVAFARGLEKFGLQKVCSQFPAQCQELFIYDKRKLLSADKLVAMIMSSPRNTLERTTLDWFVEYLTLRECSYGKYVYLTICPISRELYLPLPMLLSAGLQLLIGGPIRTL